MKSKGKEHAGYKINYNAMFSRVGAGKTELQNE